MDHNSLIPFLLMVHFFKYQLYSLLCNVYCGSFDGEKINLSELCCRVAGKPLTGLVIPKYELFAGRNFHLTQSADIP